MSKRKMRYGFLNISVSFYRVSSYTVIGLCLCLAVFAYIQFDTHPDPLLRNAWWVLGLMGLCAIGESVYFLKYRYPSQND